MRQSDEDTRSMLAKMLPKKTLEKAYVPNLIETKDVQAELTKRLQPMPQRTSAAEFSSEIGFEVRMVIAAEELKKVIKETTLAPASKSLSPSFFKTAQPPKSRNKENISSSKLNQTKMSEPVQMRARSNTF